MYVCLKYLIVFVKLWYFQNYESSFKKISFLYAVPCHINSCILVLKYCNLIQPNKLSRQDILKSYPTLILTFQTQKYSSKYVCLTFVDFPLQKREPVIPASSNNKKRSSLKASKECALPTADSQLRKLKMRLRQYTTEKTYSFQY